MSKQVSKPALGRGFNNLGLGSFFGVETAADDDAVVRSIPLCDIDPNADQPRKRFNEQQLADLAESIRAVGVIQPIILYQSGERYTLIAGERRWRAARLAGLSHIPALVRDYERIQRMEVSLIENVQRSDLNPIEEAVAIHALIEECGLSQENIAQSLGRSRPAITNLLRLLTLPAEVIAMVESGALSEGHARALVSAVDDDVRIALAQRIAAEGLSVRQAERLAKASHEPATAKDKPPIDDNLSIVETAARQAFGARVQLQGSQDKGRLVVSYASRDELERIYSVLRGAGG